MRDSGKILVVSQFYAPDSSTTAAYISAIAEALAVDNRVVVLSGSRNSGVEASGDGKPEVVEVRSWMPQKDALIRRSIAITLLALKMFFSTLKRARRGDVVFCVTTPFTVPYAVVLAAKLRGAATILLVYDLYPEALEKTGLITPSSLTARLIRLANTRLFRSLDAIITIGRDVEPLLLVYREVTSAKINLIPNWTLLPVAYRELISDNRFRAGHNSKLVVGLSGNLGFTHSPQTVFAAARLLRDNPDIHFLLSGWGIGWKELSELQAAEKLGNVTLMEPVPPARARRLPVGRGCLGHSLSAQHRRRLDSEPALQSPRRRARDHRGGRAAFGSFPGRQRRSDRLGRAAGGSAGAGGCDRACGVRSRGNRANGPARRGGG